MASNSHNSQPIENPLPPSTHVLISKATFIAIITLCATITLASLSALAWIGYNSYRRKQQSAQARAWGRRSRYVNRLSIARKQIDDAFSRQYRGVYVGECVENPELGSDSPLEMGYEEPCWEVPAVPAVPERFREKGLPPLPALPEPAMQKGGTEMSKGRKSLFFCQAVGVWLPKT